MEPKHGAMEPKHGGCAICGSKEQEILTSRVFTNPGDKLPNKALCKECEEAAEKKGEVL